MSSKTPTVQEVVDMFDMVTYICIGKLKSNSLSGEHVWDFSKSLLTITKVVMDMSSKKIGDNAKALRDEWVDTVKGYAVSNDVPVVISESFKERFLLAFGSFEKLRENKFCTLKYLLDTLIKQSALINVSDEKDADLQDLRMSTCFEHYIPHLLKIQGQMTDEMLAKLYNFYSSQPGCFRKDKDNRPKYHLNPKEELLINDPEFADILRLVNDISAGNVASFFLNAEQTEVLDKVHPALAKFGMKAFGKVFKDTKYFYFNLGNFSIPMFIGD